MASTKKIIIDTDPGVDDAIALLFAFGANELDIAGITTVNGNLSVDICTNNALKIANFANRNDVCIYSGCDKSTREDNIDAVWVHGSDGLGGVFIPPAPYKHSDTHAVDFIINKIMKSNEGEITLVALAPLTNIATAFEKEPAIASKIKEVVIMGGCFLLTGERGNASPFAEYNIFADPKSADIVFSMAKAISVIPMEVGRQAKAMGAHIKQIEDIGTEQAKTIVKMVNNTAERMNSNNGTAMYDPCTIAYLINPDLFSGASKGFVKVTTDASSPEYGMTTLERSSEGNVVVYDKINSMLFFELLNKKIANI